MGRTSRRARTRRTSPSRSSPTSARSRRSQQARPAGDGLVRQHRDLSDRNARAQGRSPRSSAGSKTTTRRFPSSMVYAYAAIREGIPYANAAPNLSADIPALVELAATAPGRRSRARTSRPARRSSRPSSRRASRHGCSASRAGTRPTSSDNRDGEVLDDPESFKTKEESKKSVLDYILQPQLYPDLYGDLCHVVRINYYPPRGRQQRRLGQHRSRGLARLSDAAQDQFPLPRQHPGGPHRARRGAVPRSGEARRACTAFRSGSRSTSRARCTRQACIPEHDLFIQLMKLKNTLRYLKGEDLITHLGRE